MRQLVLGLALLACSLLIAGVSVRRYLNAASGGPPAAPPATATVAVAPEPTATPTPTLGPTPTPPSLSARAALVMRVEDGEVLFAHDADQPLPPASTVKILTALTVLRHARPETIVTIQPEDVVDPVEESAMGLQAGDTLTIHDLLVGLLLPSGNDAARALARVVGEQLDGPEGASPEERFIAAMNELAAELGMTQSRVLTPDGEDVEGQAVSARDLALAARAFLEEPALVRIASMREATVRVGGPQARTLRLANTNALLGERGVFGIKTGTTEAAGQCLVAAWRTVAGQVYLAVVLGSQDRYADVRTLIDWVGRREG
ncbi:D-alanyl-D-alanine carboxypeptidase DacF [bacterium HR26]|nr:D-alanyl-D-alanine carboxypeptidase DacF [bacterium HR26]